MNFGYIIIRRLRTGKNVLLLVGIALLFSGCMEESESTPGKLLLRLSPRAIDSVHFTVSQKMDIGYKKDGKTNKSGNELTYHTTWTFAAGASDTIRLTARIDSVNVKAVVDGQVYEANSQTAAYSAHEELRQIATLQGITASFDISDNGITKVSTDNANVNRQLLINSRAAGNQANVADNMLAGFIMQTYAFFPPDSIAVGQSWKDTSQVSELKLKSTNTYTLKSISGNEAVIEVDGVINMPETEMPVQGYAAKGGFEGTQRGKIVVLISSGLIKSSSIDINIKGSLNLMGRTVEMSMEGVQNLQSD